MEKVVAIRDLQFDAAHRLVGHESRCGFVHGHRYNIEIHAEAPELDGVGRVIDFSVLKGRIGTWLDKNWDHNIILSVMDRELSTAITPWAKPDPGVYHLPYNPTAENIGKYLLQIVCPHLLQDTVITITKIVVHETPNCRAEVTREPDLAH